MALSQLQCLDENHVNWRVSEGKPEFFYSEDQRLALEELISRGREAFTEYLSKHGIREFLSEPEVERLARTAEAYQPGNDNQRADTGAGDDGGDGAVSLQYWPDRSENSIPDLDLGWPEAITYRGVTRVQVHTQPPMDGNIHIKEVVRKAIAQAQKVIAVVMDVFTDVDIFRDLLDACYKRKVAVYIILDFAAVPCFLLMCERAGMHTGHLKHLRVRCSGGVDFYSRSAQKVCGSLSQRFLFLDGDKAISGSYSFTWSSSRLDRQLITAMSGQTVEAFDKLFRDLYLTSRSVSLSKVQMGEEPTPEPAPSAPAPAPAPAPPSATVARKLINPKYALVTAHASPASSGDLSSHKNSTSQNTMGLLVKGRVREPVEALPLHPGLANLEKVYLVAYLPTWPEPDPAGDVIGFINVRGESRPLQTHLQRSQQFETSQAVRFSSPFSPPAPPQLPEVAMPRKHTHTTDRHSTKTHTADTHTNDTHTADTHAANTHTADTHTADTHTTDRHTADTHAADTHTTDRHSTKTLTADTHTADTPTADTHTTDTHAANTHTADTHTTDTHAAKTHTADTHTATSTHINKEKHTIKTHDIQSSPNTHTTDTATHTESDIHTASPQALPIPKQRTMQLLISPTSSLRHGQQVTVVPRTDSQSGLLHVSVSQSGSKPVSVSQSAAQKLPDSDGGLHDSDGGSSTRVLCDQTAAHSASSVSTASDEYYECDESEASQQACHGVTTGSGRDRLGHRHGEGVNMMARFSQSMLDLRPQSQHNSTVLHQSQQRTGQAPPMPYRHTGQLFQSSRSSGRDNRSRGGAKVVIAKPGSFHRPLRATGPVIGGHRYWQGQSLQPDRGWLPLDTRGSRSPGRRSPASKRSGFSSDHTSPAQPANQTALECLSFSKLISLKHMRGRDQGGASLKKTSLGNKETS